MKRAGDEVSIEELLRSGAELLSKNGLNGVAFPRMVLKHFETSHEATLRALENWRKAYRPYAVPRGERGPVRRKR
jgi:hypothetical protein